MNTNKMKTKLTKKQLNAWIQALRSGKYKQCQVSMRKGDSFCALGLGYFKMSKKKWDMESGNQSRYNYLKERGIDVETIWMMNDAGHKTFPQIADWIEANISPKED